MSKCDKFNFVGDNQAIYRVGSSKTKNRGAFSGTYGLLQLIII